ncbi:MAG: hypothetical protein ACOCXM_03715 [Myxococcota bacterium]
MSKPRRSPLRTPFFGCLLALALALSSAGCATVGGESRDNLLSDLKGAMARPVDGKERSRAHSSLVEDVVETDLLQGMSRGQVAEAIGRGEPCSRHPRCDELGFEGNDWFYHVGPSRGARSPILIVGFDRTGHVVRTWNLKTH